MQWGLSRGTVIVINSSSRSSTHHRHQHHHPPLPLPARRHIREQEVLNKLAGLVLGHSLDKQAQEVNQEVRLA